MKRSTFGPRLDRTSPIVHALYAAAIGSDSFPEALAALGDALGDCAVGMSLQPQPAPIWLSNTVFDPNCTAIMAKNYFDAASNPMVAIMAELPAAISIRRQEVVSDDVYFGSGLYNDVFRPQGLVHEAVACGYRSGEIFAPVGIFRGAQRKEFGREEFQMLSVILPHLSRSIEIYLRIGTLVKQQEQMDIALDSLHFGVIFIDYAGNVWKANARAEAVFRQNDGLTVRNRKIAAASANENRALQAVLCSGIGEGLGHRSPPDHALRITRPSSRRPYSVLALPLPVSNGNGAIKSGSVLFVSDPESQYNVSPEMLSRLFGLTPSQASLLSRLIGGENLTQAAVALDIRPETAKSHLKAVLDRTNTHRQSDLVRLVMGSPAVIRSKPAE